MFFVFFKTPLGPEIYVIELIFKPNFKTLFFFMLGFDVSKITKNPFYALNIDRITKPQFDVKNISKRHMKKNKKNIV